MATSTVEGGDFQHQSYDEFVKCSLCHKTQNESKLLRCYHGFCLCCLEKVVSQTEYNELFECPVCKYIDVIFSEDIEGLQDNFLSKTLLKIENLRPDTSKFACIGCDKKDQPLKQGHICLDCGDTYCTKCREFHCYTSVTKGHRVVPVQDLKETDLQLLQKVEKPICKNHSTSKSPQVVDIICENCESLNCQKCFMISHKSHDCIELENHIAPIKDLFREHIEAIEENIEKNRDILKEELQRLKEKKRQQDEKVYNKAEELFQMIEALKQEKLANIQRHYDKETSRLEKMLKMEEYVYAKWKSVLLFASTFLKLSSDVAFFEHFKKLKSELDNLKSKSHAFYVTTQFLEVENETVETQRDGIMAVLGTEKIKVTKSYKTYREEVSSDSESVVIQSVWSGIAPQENFSINENSEIIFPFDHSTLETSGLLFCNDMFRPTKFIWSKSNSTFPCSFLVDDVLYKEGKIYVSGKGEEEKVYIFNEGHIEKTFGIPKEEEGEEEEESNELKHLGLAVDDEGTIYACSYGNNEIFKCGKHNGEFELFLSEFEGDDISGPHYLCVDASQNLIVSNLSSSAVTAFEKSGELLWEYWHDQLEQPHGVCCDKRGRIYIASHSSSQIHVTENGSPYHIIDLEEDWFPMKVVFTEDGHLMVTLHIYKEEEETPSEEDKKELSDVSFGDEEDEADDLQLKTPAKLTPFLVKIALLGKLK